MNLRNSFSNPDTRLARSSTARRSSSDETELREYADRLAAFDPLRFEAVVHAWPPNMSLQVSRLDQIERWLEVTEAKQRFIDLGLTTPFSDVSGIFARALSELSGRPFERVLVEQA